MLDGIEKQQAELRRQEQVATQERAALAARVEALRVGLNGKDATSALLAATDRLNGLLGSVATLVRVQSPYQTAIAAAFGAAADAVAVTGLDAAMAAFDHLKAEDLGRAGLLLGGVVETERTDNWPALPPGRSTPSSLVEVPDQLTAAVQRVLRKVAVVENLPAAQSLIAQLPDVVAVTRDGDVLSAHFAAGGSSANPTLIEVQSAIDDAERRLTEASHACERLRFAREPAGRTASSGQCHRRGHACAGCMSPTLRWRRWPRSSASSARPPARRTTKPSGCGRPSPTPAEARDRDVAGLADLEHRLELAAETVDEMEPDPAERDRLAEQARLARSAEMDARLALRTSRGTSTRPRWSSRCAAARRRG